MYYDITNKKDAIRQVQNSLLEISYATHGYPHTIHDPFGPVRVFLFFATHGSRKRQKRRKNRVRGLAKRDIFVYN